MATTYHTRDELGRQVLGSAAQRVSSIAWGYILGETEIHDFEHSIGHEAQVLRLRGGEGEKPHTGFGRISVTLMRQATPIRPFTGNATGTRRHLAMSFALTLRSLYTMDIPCM